MENDDDGEKPQVFLCVYPCAVATAVRCTQQHQLFSSSLSLSLSHTRRRYNELRCGMNNRIKMTIVKLLNVQIMKAGIKVIFLKITAHFNRLQDKTLTGVVDFSLAALERLHRE
jgi:hypothetical protein